MGVLSEINVTCDKFGEQSPVRSWRGPDVPSGAPSQNRWRSISDLELRLRHAPLQLGTGRSWGYHLAGISLLPTQSYWWDELPIKPSILIYIFYCPNTGPNIHWLASLVTVKAYQWRQFVLISCHVPGITTCGRMPGNDWASGARRENCRWEHLNLVMVK